jgi:sulfite reductase (NADPH) flavoprotein alpha-component
MAIEFTAGISTPISPTATLSVPPSPGLKSISLDSHKNASSSALFSASTTIELIASRSSSSIFVYDLAEQAGFGTYTKSWAGVDSAAASVVSLQTRAGAGLSLVGRLSQGSSKDASKSAVLTAYTTPTGLAAMTQSLVHLPAPTANSKLVLQVPTVTPVGESFALSPTLAHFLPTLTIFPEQFTILLSSGPQEAVDLATLAYELADTHVVHFFDHRSSTREIGHSLNIPTPSETAGSLKDGLAQAGYGFFDYAGDKEAEVVIVLPNGPLANTAKAIASRVNGLGVVIVRVLRPWNEEELRTVVPASAKRVHVFDDVPTNLTQGVLFGDVFSALFDPTRRGPVVRSHRVTPSLTQSFLATPSSLVSFIRDFVPSLPDVSLRLAEQKKLLFVSTPGSSLAGLPFVVEQTFLAHPSISARQLTEHDILSRPEGVTVDRIVLGPKQADEFIPLSILLPVSGKDEGESDFLAVTDYALLKSHSLVANARADSALLVLTPWNPAELGSNLHADVLSAILDRNLRVYTIDVEQLAQGLIGAEGPERSHVANVVALLAFLRLYLGKAATEQVVEKLARRFVGDSVYGIDLIKIGTRAWTGLVQVELAPPTEQPTHPSSLKTFEFNAIAIETDDGETVVNGAHLGSWHDAAKHILFDSAYSPIEGSISSFEQNPALRPEIEDRTFLVTCTVNRRLTPLDYDRNVFHMEFDTRGTGLKYSIGEALGVHGWNDGQEVLDFCRWYGVDSHRLITIPVPNSDGARMHTRTVFQALQQQIDLFGKPGKGFYSALAEYATAETDRMALLFIGSGEGSATFKKLSEKDTVTFADILEKYKSARPGIETLCELIGDIKPRHYSIASAQAVVGDRVDLLVVSVDWVTPSGR